MTILRQPCVFIGTVFGETVKWRQEARASLSSRNRQTEERAAPGGAEMVHNFASTNGRPVEGPIGMLDQSRGVRAIAIVRVEVIQRRQGAG